MKKLAEFREERLQYPVEILSIPVAELQAIPIQRKPSAAHVKRLSLSMKRLGYVVPVVVVERKGKHWIIDGQHRFLAAQQAGISSLVCVKIPDRYSFQLMELNVEKQMNLREKCAVSLSVYRLYLEEDPSMAENDARILDSIEQGYYVTVGLTYEKNVRFSGSAFEPLLKKVDTFTALPLREAVEERKRRCGTLLELHERVTACVFAVQKLGISHPFLYKEVVSFANPVKRRRKVEDTFDGLFRKVREALGQLLEEPAKMRRHRFSAAE